VRSRIEHVTIDGADGAALAGRLDTPAAPPVAYALIAHCFTCTKDEIATSRITAALVDAGIGVLRFDFTGLGHSGGEFAETNFSTNVDDLRRAVDWMRVHVAAPQILIGHSLGGAAALEAAGGFPEVRAVVTIGTPSDLDTVSALLHEHLETIHARGQAQVVLAGRPFTIRRQFVEDLATHSLIDSTAELGKALLILHSPIDELVGVDHAARLFAAARHPKSYVSLDHADHLLSDPDDAAYAGQVIAAWAERYVLDERHRRPAPRSGARVTVAETTEGTFLNEVVIGEHRFLVDEPPKLGGRGAGPTPDDLLAASLGACTVMTVRMYARRKHLPVERISVGVDHVALRNHFECRLHVDGEIDDSDRARLLAIAKRCPVHRLLEASSTITTTME
jgi:uncharacterized OsmC-like protein/alpha/beta superfamily hydrolase